MSFASYGGITVVEGTVTIPTYGLWSADVRLSTDGPVPATAPLIIGDLSLSGFLYRSKGYAGHRRAWLGAGAGGWRKIVTAKSYTSIVGVLQSTVLGDVADEVGERVEGASGRIGSYYQRDADPAQQVLRRIAGPVWRVDPDGVTRIGPRSTDGQDVGQAFTLTEFDAGQGVAEVATESFSAWMPGRAFTAPTLTDRQRIQSVTHHIAANGTHRLTLMCRDDSAPEPDAPPGEVTFDDRLMAQFRQLIRAEFPRGFQNDNSDPVIDGGTGTGEHIATVEGVLNLLLGLGVDVDVMGTPTKITEVFAAAAILAMAGSNPTLSIASMGAIAAANIAKRQAGGDTPSGVGLPGAAPMIGCANVRAG